MTNTEFSNEFDVLYNSITSNQAPGLDEYEKSVFLTKAQSEILREYFNSRVDGTNGGFDGSQKRQYDFSQLIKVVTLTKDDSENISKIDNRSVCYKFPPDYFLSVNEVIADDKRQYSVTPISYSDYQRLMMKPYAYPPKNVAWRLFTSASTTTVTKTVQVETEDSATEETVTEIFPVSVAEVIGKFRDTPTYQLRYVKKPNPIILIDLTDDDVSIEGSQTESECELPLQLHQEILERAVTLAKIAYQGGSTSTLSQQQNRNNQQQ
jgi:hypothetical protein